MLGAEGDTKVFRLVLETGWLFHECDPVLVAQLYLILWEPMDCSPLGSSVHEILQPRIQSGLPFPLPGDLPDPGIESASLTSPALASELFITSAIWEIPGDLGEAISS